MSIEFPLDTKHKKIKNHKSAFSNSGQKGLFEKLYLTEKITKLITIH